MIDVLLVQTGTNLGMQVCQGLRGIGALRLVADVRDPS